MNVKKRKSEALGPAPVPVVKRQSNVAKARVFSNGGKKKMGIPGGFGSEDDDDEAEEDPADRRSSKRIRVEENEDVHKGRRVSLLAADGKTAAQKAAEERRKEREREALKKKIEARRQSTRGRPSIGGKAPVQAASMYSQIGRNIGSLTLSTDKAKPTRFGFLASAKSLVRSVWNAGAGTTKPANSATKPAAPSKPVLSSKTATERPAALHGRTANGNLQPAPPSKSSTDARTLPSGRSRGRIPSFNGLRETKLPPSSSTVPLNMRKTSNPQPSAPGVSSLGARTSMAVPSSSNTSSLGIRRTTNAPPAVTLDTKSPSPGDTLNAIPVRKRVISTLMAPTASSLAKRQGVVRPDLTTARSPAATSQNPQSLATLQQITNNARSPCPPPSRPAQIFSQPLSSPLGSPTSRPPTNENASLVATATTVMDGDGADASAVPAKPKTLIARKPHISRYKVVAKLGQQRSVSGSHIGAGAAGGRPRSSIGAGALQPVGTGHKRTGSSSSDVLMSAKKAVRHSEYIRRKSRIGGGSAVGLQARLRAPDAMEVDS